MRGRGGAAASASASASASAEVASFRVSKWAATAASIWIQCTSGSSYCFGIYSPLLKSSQAYDQSTLDSVAFFKDVGANVGLLSGLLYSSASSSPRGGGGGCWGCGPWAVHAAGAAQCFAGYFLMWLAVTGAVPRPPVPLMCFYMLMAAHAQTFFNTANVVTGVQNFPSNRGTVVGIMKGFLGLSGAILIQIYWTMFEGKPSNFLLMIALLPTVLPLLLMCLVRVHHATRGDDKQLLDAFALISLIVAGYLMVVIIWENIQSLKLAARVLIFVILLLLLVSPLVVVIRGQLRDSMLLETSCHERIHLTDDTEALVKGCEGIEAEKAHLKHDHVTYLPSGTASGPSNHGKIWLSRGEDLNLLQAMGTMDFWLLFLAMACGMGSGLATVNNISQVGGSLGYTSVETSTLVSLWSIWNFLGRFGAGYVSDFFLRLGGLARPLFIAITLGTMSIGHAVIASGLPGSLYAGSVLVGVCYGCQWSLMPTIASEIFGIRHMGTIFNTVAIASPLGSYILSVRVVGYIYDMQASGQKTCIGTHCFMLSFLIMACVTIFGSVASLALFFRTRRFYKQVVFERLRCITAP